MCVTIFNEFFKIVLLKNLLVLQKNFSFSLFWNGRNLQISNFLIMGDFSELV